MVVTDLPKLKFVKDHLCSSCELGKAKRKSFKTKTTSSSKRRLKILHMDLSGPMRVESINEGIEHQTSTAQSPEQNNVVERRNRTLVEAARTMLSAAKVPLSFGLKQLPQHVLLKTFTHGENLDKMKEKGDACIFVGYSIQSRAYMVYNKRIRVIVETIHVNFDELPLMVLDHVNTPPLNIQTTPETTSQAPTQAPTVASTENINQAETQKENAQVEEDEFINIFRTPVQERGETSS
ncbi:retrovirus-related pol polyprotein from transposon TNT 1-94 [Tanacetum coccineum]